MNAIARGNAWEWTRSAYRPYPYRDGDGRNNRAGAAPRVARGGSWRDWPVVDGKQQTPARCTVRQP